jgi:hypothetical protein
MAATSGDHHSAAAMAAACPAPAATSPSMRGSPPGDHTARLDPAAGADAGRDPRPHSPHGEAQ